jgi:hypothetical protein
VGQEVANPIQTIIEFLESVREHPGPYLGREEPDRVRPFLMGVMQTARILLGVFPHAEIQWEVWQARGWDKGGARGAIGHMRDNGLQDAAIVSELIAIEIEMWKRVASSNAP